MSPARRGVCRVACISNGRLVIASGRPIKVSQTDEQLHQFEDQRNAAREQSAALPGRRVDEAAPAPLVLQFVKSILRDRPGRGTADQRISLSNDVTSAAYSTSRSDPTSTEAASRRETLRLECLRGSAGPRSSLRRSRTCSAASSSPPTAVWSPCLPAAPAAVQSRSAIILVQCPLTFAVMHQAAGSKASPSCLRHAPSPAQRPCHIPTRNQAGHRPPQPMQQ